MKKQHTPGPWQVHETSPRSPLQIIGNIDYNADGSQIDYDVIADMGGLDADDANARLIAAAPELLASLELAVILLADCYTNEGMKQPKIKKMLEAIAKAKGE